MNGLTEKMAALAKALEAGNYNVAPNALVQGAALQIEDCSPVMNNVCAEEKDLKMTGKIAKKSCKSTLAQFDRKLSYGSLGGTAQFEGAVGMEDNSEFARITVPMCYYSTIRNTTFVANMVATVDGMKGEDRQAADAALKIATDIEFDTLRGRADFSNAGVFDGNPLAMPDSPNMFGLDAQIRASDAQANAQDRMWGEYGANMSVVIAVGDILKQSDIDVAWVRAHMAWGNPDKLYIDPLTMQAYNSFIAGSGLAGAGPQRMLLNGTAPTASGSDFRRHVVSGGSSVELEDSRFLTGKFSPARPRAQAPVVCGAVTATPDIAGTGSLAAAANYYYFATACNEAGEGPRSPIAASGVVVLTGSVVVTAAAVSGAKWYNVYRGNANSQGSCRFIGRVKPTATGTLALSDLGNFQPGGVTGMLIQKDTAEMAELAPFSKTKLALTDLSVREASFQFTTLCVTNPRKNSLLTGLKGPAALYS